jgi:hypothetical protein
MLGLCEQFRIVDAFDLNDYIHHDGIPFLGEAFGS